MCALSTGVGASGLSQAVVRSPDPDLLYSQRENIASAREAADLWAAHARTEYDAAWKLARACYYLGTLGPPAGRHDALVRGVAAGKDAAALGPARPEGHFWYAAVMGELAKSGSLFTGLRYKGHVKDELEASIAADPVWQEESARAALGRWYLDVPGIAGGDRDKAVTIFRQVIQDYPHSKTALSFLADALIAVGKPDDARPLLEQVVAEPIDPDWAPEDRQFQQSAAETLRKIGR